MGGVPRPRPNDETLSLRLAGPLLEAIKRHHAQLDLPGTLQDTTRDLITMALENPRVDEPLVREARRRAYAQASSLAYREFRGMMDQLQAVFSRALEESR
jgi:hypothetical protein